jgi:putative nucleotidyltransferase with HDIG domain
MIYDILFVAVSILEIVFMYIAMLAVEKYVFLEPVIEEKKRKRYYAITTVVLIVANIISEEIGQLLLIIFSAMHIALGRKQRKLIGTLITLPVMGVVNGVCGPIIVAPTTLMQASLEVTSVYRVIVYIVIYIGMALFYFGEKKWRQKFNEEIKNRRLHKWELVLLCGVGSVMMLYSMVVSVVPKTIDMTMAEEFSDKNYERAQMLIGYINSLSEHVMKQVFFMTVVCFVLSITAIVLVLQGNKRSYYQQQALTAQEAEKESMKRMSHQMVCTLANTIDAKDAYTNGHSTRVAQYSVMIAKRMGYEGAKLQLVEYAALLHDIGKIGIPNEIINKPSRLTDEEYAVIKTHPGIGSKILEEISEIPDIAIGARYHHERFDGKGYPEQLVGEKIPEIARIIGVADAYDAMTSNRSYRDLLSQEIVRGEIEKGKGTQFDSDIADVMLQIIDNDKEYVLHE